MTIIQTIQQDISAVLSENKLYQQYEPRWRFLLESYLGGEEYRQGQHLVRYQLETAVEYNNRLKNTPLENHCSSVISVYNSFLFREEPERTLGPIEQSPEVADFIRDADLDGRDLNCFMKDVSTWASVFGHCWIIMAKPDVQAQTQADQLAQGVRPYVNLITPLTMIDWEWDRMPNGRYELCYIKYIEEVTGDLRVVKQWTPDLITTTVVDLRNNTVEVVEQAINQLGRIPCVIAYNERSSVRGIGVSDITDIADTQRLIYNLTSEVYEAIRLDGHPSLVKTPETQAGNGAGSIIHMPENLDPGLKPYILEHGSSGIASIYESIKHNIDAIDKMANTGAVRAVESRTMSGVAMNTEFQLLNARLSEKADNLELAEEQLWKLWCQYQGTEWQGSIEYPGSFNIRDTADEIQQLATAAGTNPVDPRVKQAIDVKILDWLDLDADELATITNRQVYNPDINMTESQEQQANQQMGLEEQ